MTDVTVDVYDDKAVLEHMKEEYVGAEDNEAARASVVEMLAEELGKSIPSVRGKLGSMGVYKPKVIAKKGSHVTKQALAEKIADTMLAEYGITVAEGEVESLAKANKTVLNKLIKVFETDVEFE